MWQGACKLAPCAILVKVLLFENDLTNLVPLLLRIGHLVLPTQVDATDGAMHVADGMQARDEHLLLRWAHVNIDDLQASILSAHDHTRRPGDKRWPSFPPKLSFLAQDLDRSRTHLVKQIGRA